MLKQTHDPFADPPAGPASEGGEAAGLRGRRRRQILDAARACFAREGFHGTSMHTICAEAEMSAGALYRYFPSKEAIIAAIADEERSQGLKILGALHDATEFPAALAEAALKHLRDMERPGAVPLMMEILSEGSRNPSVAAHFRDTERVCRAEIIEAVEAAQAARRVDPALDVAAAVAVSLAVADGLVLRRCCDAGIDADRLLPLLRSVFAALFPPPGPGAAPATPPSPSVSRE